MIRSHSHLPCLKHASAEHLIKTAEADSQNRASSQSTWGKRLGEAMVQAGVRLCGLMLGEGSMGVPQPRVTWRRNGRGHSFYEVYDPASDETHRFETVAETRVWLETRYYR